MVWVYINDPGVSPHEGFTGYMSKYETTNAQYCQFLNAAFASGDITVSGNNVLGASGSNSGADFVGTVYYDLAGPGYTYNGATNGGAARINYTGSSFTVDSGFENHPVTQVSWYGSTAFCNYYGYRLPTEWEWQAVADYNGSFTYCCGTSINNSIANCLNSIHPDGTTIVGSFGDPSGYGYGMCDMAGNVWEWTSSIYSGSYRVIVSGGFGFGGYDCAVSSRHYGIPFNSGHDLGFRVCRSVLVPASAPPDSTVLQKTGIGTLRLADVVHTINTSNPTIVLTHGWNPNYPLFKTEPGQVPDWITAMKDSIFAQSWGSNWNVIWWDWLEKATSCSPAGPAKQVQWQGDYLGNALIDTLGTNYSQYIHFIGFSLGTGVNRWAVDMVHNNGWNPSKTHVTILDAAEIGDLADSIKPIPDSAEFIDNYITAFGDLHEKARNVILTQGAPILPTDILDYVDFHGYTHEWYDNTIDNPNSSYMGLFWSFENGGFNGAPAEQSCFAQTPSTSDPEGELESITWTDAQFRLGARTVV